jgi:hypothetical protein
VLGATDSRPALPEINLDEHIKDLLRQLREAQKRVIELEDGLAPPAEVWVYKNTLAIYLREMRKVNPDWDNLPLYAARPDTNPDDYVAIPIHGVPTEAAHGDSTMVHVSETTQEPRLEIVTLQLCSSCLDGDGGICHVPGCALCRSTAPDIPIRESVIPRPSTDVAGAVDLLQVMANNADKAGIGDIWGRSMRRVADELKGKS